MGEISLSELLTCYLPGHRDRLWSWEDEERDIVRVRECICCGVPGHYQEQLEAHIAVHGLGGMGICLHDDGTVWDGHHRIIAAWRLGIETIPVESRAEADERWLRDHGELEWADRRFGDLPPGMLVEREDAK